MLVKKAFLVAMLVWGGNVELPLGGGDRRAIEWYTEPDSYKMGWFSQYGLLPTDATIEYRKSVNEIPNDLSRYAGVIAVSDCDKIGEDAWIRTNETPWLRVMVFDCSGHDHTSKWMIEDNILGEIGYHLARNMNLEPGRGQKGFITFDRPYLLDRVPY